MYEKRLKESQGNSVGRQSLLWAPLGDGVFESHELSALVGPIPSFRSVDVKWIHETRETGTK